MKKIINIVFFNIKYRFLKIETWHNKNLIHTYSNKETCWQSKIFFSAVKNKIFTNTVKK